MLGSEIHGYEAIKYVINATIQTYLGLLICPCKFSKKAKIMIKPPE
jgi:hypothetical protein